MSDYRVHKVVLKCCRSELYDQFHKLNRGDKGVMQRTLLAVKNKPGSFALYIEQDGKVLGWALIFKRGEYYGKYSRKRACHIWVRPKWRQKKLGSLLIEEAIRQCKKSKTQSLFYPWDAKQMDSLNRDVIH